MTGLSPSWSTTGSPGLKMLIGSPGMSVANLDLAEGRLDARDVLALTAAVDPVRAPALALVTVRVLEGHDVGLRERAVELANLPTAGVDVALGRGLLDLVVLTLDLQLQGGAHARGRAGVRENQG